MSVVVTKAAKVAREKDPKAELLKVKLRDAVHVPDPTVKHGIDVHDPHAPEHGGKDLVIEVPAAYAQRFVRIGYADAVGWNPDGE